MDHQEREMIAGLFERMRAQGPLEKDQDAAALIAQGVRQNPDAPYMLVQSVLVQDMALQQADEKIRALEAQLRETPSRGAPASGGFLGGLFGGGRNPAPAPAGRGSVPSYSPQARSGEPGQQGSQQAPGRMGQPVQAGGGGFMRQAMATAAGVAGGMLLADGIRGMMNGDKSGTDTQTANADTTANEQAEYQDPSDNDPGVQDAGWDGGGDFDGGMDI